MNIPIPTRSVSLSELKHADVVRRMSPNYQGYFEDRTVEQVTADAVTFFRPYVHTSDFVHTGGVICYVGIERFTVPISNPTQYYLLDRKETR